MDSGDRLKSDLESELDKESTPAELPRGLPLAHLTVYRWIEMILQVGRLKPRPCKYLKKDLLYLSYGGVFYRTSKLQTEQASELPVALVLSPTVMDMISRLFPFDSGAVASKQFGPEWAEKLTGFENRFCINTGNALRDARRLVYHLFETNSQYLRGIPRKNTHKDESILSLLREFLNSNLSSLGIDHRQRTIEAIAEIPINLGRHVVWIGFPNYDTDKVLQGLYRCTEPDVPQFDTYDYTQNFNPAEMAKLLEEKAYESVIKRHTRIP